MRGLFLASILLVSGFSGNTRLVAGEPAPAVIEWQRNVVDGFTTALDTNKPLVVLFAHRPNFRGKSGNNLSNLQWEEFDKKEMHALAGHAVFVICYFDEETGAMVDKYAERMRSAMKVEDLPTTSVIVPAADRIEEIHRIVGNTTVEVAVPALRKAFSKAVERAKLPVKAVVKKVAATPEEAVSFWEGTMKNGDLDGFAELMTPAMAEIHRECRKASAELGRAKGRLTAALEDRFGKHADDLPCDDDASLIRDMKMLKRLDIERAIRFGDNATLHIRMVANDNTSRAIIFEAEKTGAGWKLIPPGLPRPDKPEELKLFQDYTLGMAAKFDDLAKKVRHGNFATRDDAVKTLKH